MRRLAWNWRCLVFAKIAVYCPSTYRPARSVEEALHAISDNRNHPVLAGRIRVYETLIQVNKECFLSLQLHVDVIERIRAEADGDLGRLSGQNFIEAQLCFRVLHFVHAIGVAGRKVPWKKHVPGLQDLLADVGRMMWTARRKETWLIQA